MNPGRRRLLILPVIIGAILGTVWLVRTFQPRESGDEVFQQSLAQIDAGNFTTALQNAETLQRLPEFKQHARLLRAILHVRSGQLDAAGSLFQDLPPDGELRPLVLLYTGEWLYRRGRPELALPLMQTLIKEQPDQTDAHRWAASIYYDIGAFSPAEHHLKQVTKLASDDFRPYHLLGIIHFDFEQYELSVPDFRAALERHPPPQQRSEIVGQLARSLMKLRRYEDAETLVKGEPETAELLGVLAQSQFALGKTSEAAATIKHAEETNAVSLETLRLKGQLAMLDGDAAAAVSTLEAAERLASFDVETQYQLSLAYRQAGRTADYERMTQKHGETTALYEEMTKLSREALNDVTDADLRLRLAEICRALDKDELAKSWEQAARVSRELQKTERPEQK